MTDTDRNHQPLEGKADDTHVTLSQAILSPLNAIFQAQVHAARSFINLILQVGYPHLAVDAQGRTIKGNTPDEDERHRPYELEFHFDKEQDGEKQRFKVRIPALAMVPLNSLAIDSAEFNFGMKVKDIRRFRQMQEAEATELKREDKDAEYKRKWFLVDNPITFAGTISSKPGQKMLEQSNEAVIDIHIKLSQSPIPAALDNLLSVLTKSVEVESLNK